MGSEGTLFLSPEFTLGRGFHRSASAHFYTLNDLILPQMVDFFLENDVGIYVSG